MYTFQRRIDYIYRASTAGRYSDRIYSDVAIFNRYRR